MFSRIKAQLTLSIERLIYIYMVANAPLAKGWWTVVYLWCRGLAEPPLDLPPG